MELGHDRCYSFQSRYFAILLLLVLRWSILFGVLFNLLLCRLAGNVRVCDCEEKLLGGWIVDWIGLAKLSRGSRADTQDVIIICII